MFQVWFMRNNANETLQGYNHRLGRPKIQIKNGIVSKAKFILSSRSWWDYFNELGVIIKDDHAIDQLLRFAVYNSKKNQYHRSYGNRLVTQQINAPQIRVNGPKSKKEFVEEGVQVGLKTGNSRYNRNARGTAWRGRGRGGTTMVQRGGRGRGRGRGRGIGRGRGYSPATPGVGQQNPPNHRQYQSPLRPSFLPTSHYQHVPHQMQNTLNNNSYNGYNGYNGSNYNRQVQQVQPGSVDVNGYGQQIQPGSVNGGNWNGNNSHGTRNENNWDTELPRRQSRSSRRRRRKQNARNNATNNGY